MNDHSVILFDGVCNLCNGLVNFVIVRDPKARFRFAALQSEAGQKLLKQFQLPADDFNTFILVESDRCYQKSTAALRVLKGLNSGWPLLYAFIIVPRPIRDFVYDAIAGNRYKWFGKKDRCLMPNSGMTSRFLETIDKRP